MKKLLVTLAIVGTLIGCENVKDELVVTFKPTFNFCEDRVMTGVPMKLSDDERWYSINLPCDKTTAAKKPEQVAITKIVPANSVDTGISVIYQRLKSTPEAEFEFVKGAMAMMGAEVVVVEQVTAREGETVTIARGYHSR